MKICPRCSSLHVIAVYERTRNQLTGWFCEVCGHEWKVSLRDVVRLGSE